MYTIYSYSILEMKQLQRTLVSEKKTNYTWWYEVVTTKQCKYEWFNFVYTQTYRKIKETEDISLNARSSELCVQWISCLYCIATNTSLVDNEVIKYVEEHKWKLTFHSSTFDELCKELFKRSTIQDYATFRSKCWKHSFFYMWWFYLYWDKYHNAELGL